MLNQEEQDVLLCQLIQQVLQQADGSRQQKQAMESLLKMIPNLPSISRPPEPTIDDRDALNRAYEGVWQSIKRFPQLFNLDIDNADAVFVRECFVKWFKRILKNKIVDIYRQKGQYLSLDAPINPAEGGITFGETLPTSTPSGWNNIIENEQRAENQRLDGELRLYIEVDPEGKLRNCYPRKNPQCNCQELAKRRLLKDPPDKWTDIIANFKVPYGTVTAHWQRRCEPLLQEIAQDLGYQTEQEL